MIALRGGDSALGRSDGERVCFGAGYVGREKEKSVWDGWPPVGGCPVADGVHHDLPAARVRLSDRVPWRYPAHGFLAVGASPESDRPFHRSIESGRVDRVGGGFDQRGVLCGVAVAGEADLLSVPSGVLSPMQKPSPVGGTVMGLARRAGRKQCAFG